MIAFVCVCVCCFFVGVGAADSSCSVSGVIGWSGISFASGNSADRPNDTRGRDLDSKYFWAFISEATLQEIRPGGLPIYKEYNRTKYAIPVGQILLFSGVGRAFIMALWQMCGPS